MSVDPLLKHDGPASRPGSSGPSLRDIEARAKAQMEAQLTRINSKRSRYAARLKRMSLGVSSGEIRITISGEGVWGDVAATRDALQARIEEALQSKYGGRFDVRVTQGSITITIIYAALETARYVYELVSSLGTIVEYVIRCIEQERWEWPPIASMFTFFESLKKLFLGL